MNLPEEIAEACKPLFEALPLNEAMTSLTGSQPKRTELVKSILAAPEIASRPALISGLWLYVDDLERSHTVSQDILDATGSYWHGIMHRREGDFSNAHYWMHRAETHPLLRENSDLDPHGLIDSVAAANSANPADRLQQQRAEWKTLFAWCANR